MATIMTRNPIMGTLTGTITGTPAKSGVFHVRVRVRDALGATSTKTIVLTVR